MPRLCFWCFDSDCSDRGLGTRVDPGWLEVIHHIDNISAQQYIQAGLSRPLWHLVTLWHGYASCCNVQKYFVEDIVHTWSIVIIMIIYHHCACQGARWDWPYCKALTIVAKAGFCSHPLFHSYHIWIYLVTLVAKALVQISRHFVELPYQPWLKALFASWRVVWFKFSGKKRIIICTSRPFLSILIYCILILYCLKLFERHISSCHQISKWQGILWPPRTLMAQQRTFWKLLQKPVACSGASEASCMAVACCGNEACHAQLTSGKPENRKTSPIGPNWSQLVWGQHVLESLPSN